MSFHEYLKAKHSPYEVARRNDALNNRRNQIENLIQRLEEAEDRVTTFDNMEKRIQELRNNTSRSDEESEELETLLVVKDFWQDNKNIGSNTEVKNFNDGSISAGMNSTSI